jgi:hypothetical protein
MGNQMDTGEHFKRHTQVTNGDVRLEEFSYGNWKLEALTFHTDGSISFQYFDNYATNQNPSIEGYITVEQAARTMRRWGEMQMQAIEKELAA